MPTVKFVDLGKQYMSLRQEILDKFDEISKNGDYILSKEVSEFEENLENFRFVIRTVQASAFRTLIEALKEILTDVNIEIDASGMKIIAMDTSHVALIHMKLLSKNFEKYYCPKPVVCGISMMRLFKLLKTMSPNDTLTFYVEDDEPNLLKIQIETGEKNLTDLFTLRSSR